MLQIHTGSLFGEFESGKFTVSIGSDDDSARSVVHQSDGKFVVSGVYVTGSDLDIFLQRYHADGSLDTSFNNDGLVTIAPTANDDIAHDVGLDENNFIVVAGSVDSGSDLDFLVARFSTNGDLDTAFDNDGMQTYDVVSNDLARTLEFQNASGNEKILLIGTANKLETSAAIRLNSNGDLDTTFDVDGIVTNSVYITSMGSAVQQDNKFVVAGSPRTSTGSWNYGFLRYNTNGSLDTTFHVDGLVTGSLVNEHLFDVSTHSTDSDGEKILATGHSNNSGTRRVLVIRLVTNGQLDTTFHIDGIQTVALEEGRKISVQTNGHVVVSGFTFVTSNLDLSLLRLGSNGILDTSFELDGTLSLSFGSDHDVNFGLSQIKDSQILTVGKTMNSDWDLNIVRYDYLGGLAEVGTLDSHLNSDGLQTTDMGGDAKFNSVEADSNGFIVAAGDGNTTIDFVVNRYILDGTLDTTFDNDGIVTTRLHADGSTANDMAIDDSGRIILAGSLGLVDIDSAVARYNTDGSLDTTFHVDGVVTTDVGTKDNTYFSVAHDSSNRVYAAGASHDGTDHNLLIARYNTNGTLDTTFNNDGINTLDFLNDDVAYSLNLDSSDMVLVSGYSHNGTEELLILSRFLTNGSLDTAFSLDGTVTLDAGSGAIGIDVVKSNGEHILIGGSANNGSNEDFLLVRYASNGSLDTSFELDGISSTNFPTNENVIGAIALQTNEKIVVGGVSYNGSDDDSAIARFLTNGQLDTTLDSDGVSTFDLGSSANEAVNGIYIESSSGMIISAGRLDSGSDWELAIGRFFP